MDKVLILTIIFVGSIFAVSHQANTTTHRPEHGEYESFNFAYEGTTQLMLMYTAGKCYIWQLSPTEKANVHTDSGIRAVELRLLKQVNNAYFTKVPMAILHTQVRNQCMLGGHFYLVH